MGIALLCVELGVICVSINLDVEFPKDVTKWMNRWEPKTEPWRTTRVTIKYCVLKCLSWAELTGFKQGEDEPVKPMEENLSRRTEIEKGFKGCSQIKEDKYG